MPVAQVRHRHDTRSKRTTAQKRRRQAEESAEHARAKAHQRREQEGSGPPSGSRSRSTRIPSAPAATTTSSRSTTRRRTPSSTAWIGWPGGGGCWGNTWRGSLSAVGGPLRAKAGDYVRTWGLRTGAGFQYTAPTRARGLLARRHVDDGGQALLVAHGLEIVGHGRDATLRIGKRVSLREGVRLMFEGDGRGIIELGDDVFINARSEIRCEELVSIGRGSILSFDVTVMDTDFHQLEGADRVAPVTIGEHTWIGARAMILKGVTIGAGAVIAAAAVVTSDVPPACLVAGSPARVIRDGVVWNR
jgi:acetyltransferase-like isoleucine patch superfamily enzyme